MAGVSGSSGGTGFWSTARRSVAGSTPLRPRSYTAAAKSTLPPAGVGRSDAGASTSMRGASPSSTMLNTLTAGPLRFPALSRTVTSAACCALRDRRSWSGMVNSPVSASKVISSPGFTARPSIATRRVSRARPLLPWSASLARMVRSERARVAPGRGSLRATVGGSSSRTTLNTRSTGFEPFPARSRTSRVT